MMEIINNVVRENDGSYKIFLDGFTVKVDKGVMGEIMLLIKEGIEVIPLEEWYFKVVNPPKNGKLLLLFYNNKLKKLEGILIEE